MFSYKFIIIIVIILIIVSLLYLETKNKRVKMSKTKQKNNIALLFTSYNVKERQDMTLDVINYYINDLKFSKSNLYLVDSSNNGVSYDIIPKENQIVFNQNDFLPKKSSTHTELLSLSKCSDMFSKYDYVFKLTCKYKLKKFLYLKFPLNHDLILQHNSSIFYKYTNTVNSEIIGFNGKKMPEIIEEINNVSLQDYTKILEEILYQSKNKKDYAILPKLENLAYYKRGNGSYLKYL